MLPLHLHPFFFFNDTATTEIYTLSLHDALPICHCAKLLVGRTGHACDEGEHLSVRLRQRSEEHTSELQSRSDLVCRLLLEKKKKYTTTPFTSLLAALLQLTCKLFTVICSH